MPTMYATSTSEHTEASLQTSDTSATEAQAPLTGAYMTPSPLQTHADTETEEDAVRALSSPAAADWTVGVYLPPLLFPVHISDVCVVQSQCLQR